MKAIWLALAPFLLSVAASPDPIVIAAPMTLQGEWKDLGMQCVSSLEMWVEFVNKQGGVQVGDGVKRPLKLNVTDVGASTLSEMKILTKNAIQQYKKNPPTLVILPYSSDLAIEAANNADDTEMILIAPGSASEDVYCSDTRREVFCLERRHRYLYGTMTPAVLYSANFIAITKVLGASTSVLLCENFDFTHDICSGATYYSNQAFVDVLDVIIVDASNVSAAITRAMSHDPDVVIGGVYEELCGMIALQWQKLQLKLPKALLLTTCTERVNISTEMQFVMTPAQWAPQLRGVFYEEGPNDTFSMFPVEGDTDTRSPMQFSNAFEQKTNSTPNYFAASCLAAAYSAQLGLMKANSTDPKAIGSALDGTLEYSFYGMISFDKWGRNLQKWMVLLQFDKNLAQQVVEPIFSSSASAVYPMPQWDERVFKLRLYATDVEIACTIVLLLCMLFYIAMLVMVVLKREDKTLKRASPPFLGATLCGAILLVAAVALAPMQNNDLLCRLQQFLLPIGFAVYICPLASRTFRIYYLLKDFQTLKKKQMSSQTLLLLTGLVLAPFLLMEVLWFALDPLKVKRIVQDPLRPGKSTECPCDYGGSEWYLIALGMLAVVSLVVCAVLSWLQMRLFTQLKRSNAFNADDCDDFSDAHPLGIAVFTNTLCVLLVFGSAVSGLNMAGLYIIRTACVILSTLFGCFLMMFPRLWRTDEEISHFRSRAVEVNIVNPLRPK